MRLGSRHALRAFAGLEAAIAAFGAFSTTLYYDWLYLELGRLYSPAWRAALDRLGPPAESRRVEDLHPRDEFFRP